jgi:DNA-binding NarL/FixJ family response regulator
MKCNALLVEDSMLFRQALLNLLGRSPNITAEACASDRFARGPVDHRFDVILLDVVTWSSGTSRLADSIKTTAPLLPVLLLVNDDFLERHSGLVPSEICGFIQQTAEPKKLLEAIKVISGGAVWFERALFRKLAVRAAGRAAGRREISAKEADMLRLVVGGKTNKEIGVAMGYSERTVKAFVSRLFLKTGAPTRSALASFAIASGVVTDYQHPAQ